MKVTGINHITLAVTNLATSIAFYRDILGCELRAQWAEGAYLEAGNLWLCLAQQDQEIADRSHDYSHIAFSVSEIDFNQHAASLSSRLHIWKENRSEGNSIYFLDPDGHRLEIHIGDLNSRLQHYIASERQDIVIYS